MPRAMSGSMPASMLRAKSATCSALAASVCAIAAERCASRMPAIATAMPTTSAPATSPAAAIAEAMTPQKSARDVQATGRHRLQRPMLAIAIEILGERDRRVVALGAIRRERTAQHRAKLVRHIVDRGHQFVG